MGQFVFGFVLCQFRQIFVKYLWPGILPIVSKPTLPFEFTNKVPLWRLDRRRHPVDQSDSRKLPGRPITSLQICVGAKLWLTLANGPDNPVPELTPASTPTALQRWQNSIVSLLSTASQQCKPSNSEPKPNKMKNRM